MTHDLNHPSPTLSTSLPVLSADGSPVPMHWVEDLFARLAAIVGASSMQQVYGGIDTELVKGEWAATLAGFTADEVGRGIASVRLRKFAPNLPDFLHLCRPALDHETAWNEAYDGVRYGGRGAFAWSHPAVYWAATEMGYELRNGTYAQHRKRWDALMQRQWLAEQWRPVPLQVGHQQTRAKQRDLDGVPKSSEEVTAMLHDLRTRLTGHPTRQAEIAAGGAYTEAELADQRRAQQLAGQG